ncbi:uncharacterized protein RHO25_002521 [Cercospora beticola]|uniref:BTB domain-containing protein n=1 Tax=Cercospora beticola TaxID=122368 RepID=A0ABZ0NEG1_CERBT|nr:hypothetical protein RHO25_002521 [Cercospora beticola]
MSSDSTNIGDAARSEAILCLVGAAKTKFFVHRALLKHRNADPLCPIEMKSEKDPASPVRIEYVDAETFARYIEYLYTGEYTAAEPRSRIHSYSNSASESDTEVLTPSALSDASFDNFAEKASLHTEKSSFGETMIPPEKTAEQSKQPKEQTAQSAWKFPWKRQAPSLRQQAWESFVAKLPSGPQASSKPAMCMNDLHQDFHEDYTEVFLSHAKLYIFAAMWSAESLRKLSLRRLHESLVHFTPCSVCVGDVAILLRHVHHDTDSLCNIAELKAVVIDYVACHVEKLAQNSIFQQTMQDSNEAAVDLIQSLLRRLDT